MKILTVIPTYNERVNVEPLVRSLVALPLNLSVLFVDDRSPDGTADRVREIAREFPTGRVEVMVRTGAKGFAASYIDGFRHASHMHIDAILQMDADGQHPASAIPDLVETMERTHADLVIASRYVAGGGTGEWATVRRLISEFGGFYARRVLNVPYMDLTGGFKLWRRDVLEKMPLERLTSKRFSIQIETTWLAHRMGAHIVETPFTFAVRERGESNMSAKVVLEGLLRVLQWAASPLPVPALDRGRRR
ncbi:MAG: polyprenol monophosphomannose synthase [Planctomycetes bacterium]|nr:polyprenol monophosphomannose synthase [Planctomycetota bacterium]NUQ35672.1 polyprenol monophosphomannose synthase [Planctomycetaceae bacterium]